MPRCLLFGIALGMGFGCHRDAPAPGSPSPTEVAAIASSGPIELPDNWKTCASNSDCVIAAYGCCSKVPTHRAHAQAVRTSMRDSGRYCPVKAACGRGPDGTDDGEPAECDRGRCVLPVVLPADATACTADGDCVVATLDCCNKVAVYKTYEKQALLTMLELETDRPGCPPTASCPDPPPVCVAAKCQRGTWGK